MRCGVVWMTAVCDPDCANGGQCVGPYHCVCTKPFTGPSCDDDPRRQY